MKNRIYLFFFLAVLIGVGISCKKDEIAPETTRNVPKATIKGVIWADLDASSNSPGLETGPSGIKVIARIWAPDLAPGTENSRVSQSYITFEGTTDGSGAYSIQVDASSSGVNVTLLTDDFAYNQKQGLHPIDSVQLAPIRRVYSADDQFVSVIAGGTTVRDIAYNEFR